MLTEKDIKEQLDKEQLAQLDKIYDVNLPENFLDMFKRAIMTVPVTIHKKTVAELRVMISKRSDELTVSDVGFMINTVYATPFANLYHDIHQALDVTAKFDEIRIRYNKESEKFMDSQERKRRKLMELAGLSKSVPFNQTVQPVK